MKMIMAGSWNSFTPTVIYSENKDLVSCSSAWVDAVQIDPGQIVYLWADAVGNHSDTVVATRSHTTCHFPICTISTLICTVY